MKKIIVLLSVCSVLAACSQTDCSTMRTSFTSYEGAIDAIESTSFEIAENVTARFRDWMDEASYYFCDGSTGYFIYSTEGREYLYDGVPLNVWQGFKDADSFGSYYVRKIKGRYKMRLE